MALGLFEEELLSYIAFWGSGASASDRDLMDPNDASDVIFSGLGEGDLVVNNKPNCSAGTTDEAGARGVRSCVLPCWNYPIAVQVQVL